MRVRIGISLLAAGALALAGCSGQPPEPPEGASESPLAPPTVEPVEKIGGIDQLGLSLATASIRTVPGGWIEDSRGITYFEPFKDGATSLVLVRIGMDGQERWRETVRVPSYSRSLHPRFSRDEGAGRIAVWFSTDSGNDNGVVIGDIRWFDLDSGDNDVIAPRRPDDQTRIESWGTIIGYITYASGGSESVSFSYLDEKAELVTREWSDVLRTGEQAWLSAVTQGKPSFSIKQEDGAGFRLQFGDDVIFKGGGDSTKWAVLGEGVHAFVGVPGSKFVVVDGEGKVLLDYGGDCDVSSSYVDGRGTQFWSGALIYDFEQDKFECLTAVGDRGGRITGMTREGIALAQTSDGTMVVSEPRYTTLVETKVEALLFARDRHVLSYQARDDKADVTIFNSADLRPR